MDRDRIGGAVHAGRDVLDPVMVICVILDSIPKTKKCTKCGEIKPLDDFRYDKRWINCKCCRSCKNLEQREKSRLKGVSPRHFTEYIIIDGISHKKCSMCMEIKPLNQFYFHKRHKNKDGFEWSCKRCMYLNNRKWRIDNRDHYHDYMNKRTSCAKRLCPAIRSDLVESFNCPVCGKVFGKMRSVVKSKINSGHSGIFYCSHPCYHISTTKAWREKSPYAKKIKRLRKMHGI